MTMDPLFAYWDWEDPDALAATFEKLTADLARCETLDLVARRLPVTRQDFLDIGLTGIEFAAFKTRHPAGLGTDLVGFHTATATTEPGLLYRADGTRSLGVSDRQKIVEVGMAGHRRMQTGGGAG